MPFISDQEYAELKAMRQGPPDAGAGQPTTRPTGVGGQYQSEAQTIADPSRPRELAPPAQAQRAFATNPTQAPVSSMTDKRNRGAAAWQTPENQGMVKQIQQQNPGAVWHPETGTWTAPQGMEAQSNFNQSVFSAGKDLTAGRFAQPAQPTPTPAAPPEAVPAPTPNAARYNDAMATAERQTGGQQLEARQAPSGGPGAPNAVARMTAEEAARRKQIGGE